MIDSQIYYLPYTNCIFALHYLLCLLYHEPLYPEQGTIAELYHDRNTDLNLVKAT